MLTEMTLHKLGGIGWTHEAQERSRDGLNPSNQQKPQENGDSPHLWDYCSKLVLLLTSQSASIHS